MNYYKVSALNSGTIKSFLNMTLDDEEKWIRPFDIGSVLDFYLTESGNFDDFFEIYSVEEPPKGTNDAKFAEACIKQKLKKGENYDYEAAWLKTGMKTPLGKFLENFKYFPYLEVSLKKKFSDKTVVLQTDVDLAKSMVMKLINHRVNHCKYLVFIKDVYETYGQVEVYGYYNKCFCKIKIDRLIIDYVNKTVQLLDVKSTGDFSSNFERNAEHFKYNIQADFYWSVFNAMQWTSPQINMEKVKGFKLLEDFIFLVVPKNDTDALSFSYMVNKENPDIIKATHMWNELEEKGLPKNKQTYYEMRNEIEDLKLNKT